MPVPDNYWASQRGVGCALRDRFTTQLTVLRVWQNRVKGGDRRPLDPVETSAVFYLVAPLLIFAGTFLRWEIAIPACALILLQLRSVVRLTAWLSLKDLWSWQTPYLMLFAALWVGMSFGLGPSGQTADWFKHYGVLNFLVSDPWPPTTDIDGIGPAALRYYVGWYLVPAAVLKLTSWPLQQAALFVWSALGVFIFLQLVMQIVAPRRIFAILGTPFIIALFGCPNAMRGFTTSEWLPDSSPMGDWWFGWIIYPGNSISLAFVPQHTIAGWLSVALLMRQRDQGPLLPFCMLLLCAVALWSPFSAIGILPFLVALVAHNGVYPLFMDWRGFASLLLLGLPIGLFLHADTGTIPAGFVIANPCLAPGACFSWSSYILFLIAEVGIPLGVLCLWRKHHQPFFVAAAVALMLIPLYKLGLINDFGARTCLPALMLISIFYVECIMSGPIRYSVVACLVLLAAVPDFYKGTRVPSFHVPTSTTIESIEREELWQQYFARPPIWILRKRARAANSTLPPTDDKL
jgi:hypothetical protein